MSYVAIKGGAQAIRASQALSEYLRTGAGAASEPLAAETIRQQLRLLHSRVLSEGGIYHPQLAALAIKQCQGDTLEAAFSLRAYRSTQPRLLETAPIDSANMRLTRRISAAFKDIPGGQSLGATSDYQLRFLRLDLLQESPQQFQQIVAHWFDQCEPDQRPQTFAKVLDILRRDGLLPPIDPGRRTEKAFDITREPLVMPLPRSAALATMSRAEQGSLLAMAYSNMRGYGDIHPTVAEMRVGYLPVLLPHPISGELVEVGEVEFTECEVIATYEGSPKQKPTFSLGYGACFGHNEVKAISMAIVDRALQLGSQRPPQHPSEDAEFVLLHIDGTDSMGFCSHYKMPHYVTFQSDMDRLRATQRHQQESGTRSDNLEGESSL